MPEITPAHNQFAYSVSEVAMALKRVVEDNFGQVRVRGEISGYRGPHSSGHSYFRLKDEKAVLEVVSWRGTKIPFRLEEGLEVIITGNITTYPGSSKYQIVVKEIEPAGIGALMALLEKRKAMLAAEGLFDASRKKPLPFMPQVIGVITSPTGAVIRDILHRLSDRFPCHVLIWPVIVQGEGAAEQVAAAIKGFNALAPHVDTRRRSTGDDLAGEIARSAIGGSVPPGIIPRPDLLIVARGGGSLEDLWAFNEEIVVRAAAASEIPLISAVGHETDTTLIDYVSDQRAPTPTAAAEMAVPVREEYLLAIMEHAQRLVGGIGRMLETRREMIAGLARGLAHPRRLLDVATQRLDDWGERLVSTLPLHLAQKNQQLAMALARLQPKNLLQHIEHHTQNMTQLGERMARMILRTAQDREQKLAGIFQVLESLSPDQVLKRGFVLVRGKDGGLITRAAMLPSSGTITLAFHDGTKKLPVT